MLFVILFAKAQISRQTNPWRFIINNHGLKPVAINV